jgi:transposase
MTGLFYIEILRNHLPEIRNMLYNNWHFQQDNNPKHTSHVTKEFFKNNIPTVIDWPFNSPDLNPIENLWAILKRNVEMWQPKNIGKLERFMKEEWIKISQNIVIDLIESMKECCKLIIEKNEKHIPY